MRSLFLLSARSVAFRTLFASDQIQNMACRFLIHEKLIFLNHYSGVCMLKSEKKKSCSRIYHVDSFGNQKITPNQPYQVQFHFSEVAYILLVQNRFFAYILAYMHAHVPPALHQQCIHAHVQDLGVGQRQAAAAGVC